MPTQGDRAHLLAGYKPPAPPPPKPRERLFEFTGKDGATWRCELVDHSRHGVEAQFVDGAGELRSGRLFQPYLNLQRTPREMAIGWAEEHRKNLEGRMVAEHAQPQNSSRDR